jgi:hypothetical protein
MFSSANTFKPIQIGKLKGMLSAEDEKKEIAQQLGDKKAHQLAMLYNK